MDFALLGIDPHSLALCQAAVRQGHRLVWATELAGREAQVAALAPGVTFAPHWEALLGGAIARVVIVAPSESDERAEQLRKLAAERVPLLVCHPVHSSTLLHLELDMIRRDAGGVIFPYIPARWHPAVAHVSELLAAGKLGALEQVICERFSATRTRPAVLRAFMEDVTLLRMLLGDVTKVGAMASTAGEAGFANLGVQLTGPSGVLARWSVAPIDELPGARLTLVGSEGKVVLRMPEPSDAGGAQAPESIWFVEESGSGASQQRFDGASAPAVAIDAMLEALANPVPPDDWAEAVRAAQLTEAVERSLRRSRVISLEFDEHTEEGTFKGIMTSVGCLTLLMIPLVAVVLSAVAPSRYSFGSVFFAVLAVGLALFLLLQLLLLIIPKKGDR